MVVVGLQRVFQMKRAYLRSFALTLSVVVVGGAGTVAAKVVAPNEFEAPAQQQLDQLVLEQSAAPATTQLAAHSSHVSHASHASHCSSMSYC